MDWEDSSALTPLKRDDPAMMSFLLSTIEVDEAPDYLLEPLDLDDFRVFVARLRLELADAAFPE